MHISSLDIIGNGLGGLSQNAQMRETKDSSIFDADIDAQTIANLLNSGVDKDKIVEDLVNSAVPSDNEELTAVIKNKIENFVNYVQFQVFKNNSQNTDEPLNNAPVSEGEQNWDLSESGNLFTENITQENFVNEFNALSEQGGDSAYLNAINQMGAENFFATLDVNGDGTLDKGELETLINSDGNAASISAEEFNNIFYQYLGETGIPEETIPEATSPDGTTAPEATTGTDGTNTDNKTKKSSKKSHHSSDKSDPTPTPEEKKDTVEDLMKQKQSIISEADSKISALNTELSELIANSDADSELKENYNTAKEAYDSNENAIKENETQIQSYDQDLHNIAKSLAALNGEYSTLETNTNDEETNRTNSARKSEIESQIRELESKQQEIERQKQELEEKNTTLKNNSTTLKAAVDEAMSALQSVLSEDIKGKIEEIKTQIQTLEANKASEVSEIDAKIQTLKAEEITDSRESGEATGKFASNPIGSKFVQEALKYKGYKENADGSSMFSSGDYGWCADFVTYVVKSVAESLGMSKDEVKAIRSHLGASPQKLVNRNEGHAIDTSKYSVAQLRQMIKPGMAFVCKGSGASGRHTGFVAEVNDDGTFVTIEGNSNNMVRQQTRNISDMYYFVDFSYLFA